jgi:hypothetical protein
MSCSPKRAAITLGLVLAHQHLGQLTSATREAIVANARTRVVFQCGLDDARALAAEFEPALGEGPSLRSAGSSWPSDRARAVGPVGPFAA